MRLAAVLSVLVMTAVAPTHGAAQTTDSIAQAQTKPAVLTNPAWAIPPRAEYPEAAMSEGVMNGRVDLECRVGGDGGLSACEILGERPAGVGFGRAALRAAAGARISTPVAADLAPDGIVRFAVTFTMR